MIWVLSTIQYKKLRSYILFPVSCSPETVALVCVSVDCSSKPKVSLRVPQCPQCKGARSSANIFGCLTHGYSQFVKPKDAGRRAQSDQRETATVTQRDMFEGVQQTQSGLGASLSPFFKPAADESHQLTVAIKRGQARQAPFRLH